MTKPPTLLDPDEYRRRALRCRELADASPTTRLDFLAAAETWEMLATQAEGLIQHRESMQRKD
jgi:hypothetical protein